MALSDSDVRHVARLARLGLAEGEAERLRDELVRILDHVSQIAQLDLAGVPPTSHPLDLVNVTADDAPHDSLPLEDVLSNAPVAEGGLFKVPPWR